MADGIRDRAPEPPAFDPEEGLEGALDPLEADDVKLDRPEVFARASAG